MENSAISKRDKLVLTAVEIIDEMGIQGLSTREVARRLGMSNAAIFNHFKSKNELIHAVLDHYATYDQAVVQSTEARHLSSIDSIRHYYNLFYTYFENYPSITAVHMSFNELHYDETFKLRIKSILQERNAFLNQSIQRAQHNGEIRTDISSSSLCDMLQGSFTTTCLDWRIKQRNYSLKDRLLTNLDTLLNAVTVTNKRESDSDAISTYC